MSGVKTARRKPTIVLSHWIKLIDKLEASPQDFYTRVEQALEERQVPDLEVARVDWHEGGALSAKREYLRLTRNEFVIDICGAPFGNGFFVSNRFAEIPLRIGLWRILAILLLLYFYLVISIQLVGLGWSIAILILALLLFIIVMRQALARGLADVDKVILKIPILALIYERYLRRLTYYRIDTYLMYQHAVHAAVMQVIDEMTDAQDISPLSEFERKPVLRELYRR